MAVSVRTHDLLEFTLEKFAEFSLVYCIYILTTFWGAVVSIAGMAGAKLVDDDWLYMGMLYIFGCVPLTVL